MFEFGKVVKYKPTGFEGVITAKITYYDDKPDQYMLEGNDSTGRPIEFWADVTRLEEK